MRAGESRPLARPQAGFTLLAVLFAMTLLALASQGVMFVLSQQASREREAELLRIGNAYVRAIRDYYESSPGSVKFYPLDLSELLEDRRHLGIRRHLRALYPDPVTGSAWGLVRGADGRVQGIYSTSEREPIRSAAIDLGELRLPAARRYVDWKFVFLPAPGEGR